MVHARQHADGASRGTRPAATLAGQAVPVAEQVRIDNGQFRGGVFSVSAAGTLVFQRDASPGFELVWYDRSGRRLGTLGTPADYADVQLAPDGQRALVSVAPIGTTTRDLWIFDIARGLRTRFTFEDAHPIRGPIWSPDGARVVFATERDGPRGARAESRQRRGRIADLAGRRVRQRAPQPGRRTARHLLFARRVAINDPTLMGAVDGRAGRAAPLPQARARFPQFSPDGRWIVYVSPESGRTEVYVAPFPGPGSSVQISTAGGFNPRWRADGREILYQSITDNKLMAAAVTAER